MLKSAILPVSLNANSRLAEIGDYCFGEVALEEDPECSFNSTIFGVGPDNVEQIRANLPVPVHAKIIQLDGYKTVMYEVDENALS